MEIPVYYGYAYGTWLFWLESKDLHVLFTERLGSQCTQLAYSNSCLLSETQSYNEACPKFVVRLLHG